MSQPSIVKISLTVAGFLAALVAIGTPVFFAGRWVTTKDKEIEVGNLTREIGRLRSTIVRKEGQIRESERQPSTPTPSAQDGDNSPIEELEFTIVTGSLAGSNTANSAFLMIDHRVHKISNRDYPDLFKRSSSGTVRVDVSRWGLTRPKLARTPIILYLDQVGIHPTWYVERVKLRVKTEGAKRFTDFREWDAIGWLSYPHDGNLPVAVLQ